MKSHICLGLRGLFIFPAVLFWGTATTQASVPSTIVIQGSLVDSDMVVLAGERAWSVQFYDAETGGTALGSTLSGSTTVGDTGRWAISLTPPAGAVLTDGEVWYALGVDSAATPDGAVDAEDWFEGRIRVESVIFAQRAASADTLAGMDADDFATDTELTNGLAAKADLDHTHAFSELTGEAVDAQIPDDITILEASHAAAADAADLATTATVAQALEGFDPAAKADAADVYTKTETGALLSGKSDTGHDHAFAELTGTAVDAQIPDDITILAASHASDADHALAADMADLATTSTVALALDGFAPSSKSDVGHGHAFAELTGTAVDAQIPDDITILAASHASDADHALAADMADLATTSTVALALDGFAPSSKSDVGHEHAFAELTGTAVDAQIPDDITILAASHASDADHALAADNATTAAIALATATGVNLTGDQSIDGVKTFTSPIAGDVTGTASNVTGIVALGNGGTGAGAASGARDNLGLGSMAVQDSGAVSISGGAIDATPIGSTAPASGAFTTLNASGATAFTGASVVVGEDASSQAAVLTLHDADNATSNTIALQAPPAIASDVAFTLPDADGSAGQALTTNGGGELSFSTVNTLPISGTTVAIADGATVFGNGVAMGVNANGQNYGTVIGYRSNADSLGAALGYRSNAGSSGAVLGYRANADLLGAALGYQANGYDSNVAIGYLANGFTGTGSYAGSVSVGYKANSFSGDGIFSGSVAVGYYANARHNIDENFAGAVAIGHYANAYIRGVAVGGSCGNRVYGPCSGYNRGVAIGFGTKANSYGSAMGYMANGFNSGTAIGYRANSGGNHGYSFAKGAYSRCTRYGEEWKGADELTEESLAETSSDYDRRHPYLLGNNNFGYGQCDFHGVTTDAVATEIFLSGEADERFTLLDNSAVMFTAHVVAVNTTTGDSSVWKMSGGVKRRGDAAATALIGAVSTGLANTEGGLTTAPVITADTANGALIVTVTGVVSNTVQWNVMLSYSEVRE